MKTIYDLEKMKARPCVPFGNAYSYLIARLTDCYIGKSDGIERLMCELSEWDAEAKAYIISLILDEIENADTMFFDEDNYDWE